MQKPSKKSIVSVIEKPDVIRRLHQLSAYWCNGDVTPTIGMVSEWKTIPEPRIRPTRRRYLI